MIGGIRFGSYRFDSDTAQLWDEAREIRLTPKAAAVLRILVSHAGAPVTKDQLFAAVWTDTSVSDDALTSCIQELRRAFADDAKQPRFIETRHRRGYCFIAAVEASAPAAPAVSAAPTPAVAAAAPILAIAVLPFADMSPSRDHDYLCEGIAEELINALTQLEGLRVVSRTASFQFRSMGADVRSVGAQLGAGALLEGSVRTADDRLRITVQLVDVATGYHRWAQRFDRQRTDVFAMQDEIAESVATSLRGGVLSGQERRAIVRPPTAPLAYEYYLRGRQLLPRMTQPDLAGSAELFSQAIAVDERYGPAWAGLATVHATLYEWFGAADADRSAADHASRRALAVAPDQAESHVARGVVLALTMAPGIAEAFEQAIHLNPNLFDAYYYYARACFALGEIARSAELFSKAGEVRQEDCQGPLLRAQSLRMLGRADEAAAASREGIRRAEHALALNPTDARALALGASELVHDQQLARALSWSERALDLYPDNPSALTNGACLRATAGDQEGALALLDRVFARGWGKRAWIERDPDYDSLRDDPRFQRLIERLK